MPVITTIDPGLLDSAFYAMDWGAVRSPGPHVKPIVDDLARHCGYGKKLRDDLGEGDLDEFGVFGFVWERVIERALNISAVFDRYQQSGTFERLFERALLEVELERRPKELIRPGEQELDGIFGTPDALNVRTQCLEEWKCTWVSFRKGDEDFESAHWVWLHQAACYCYMLGINEAVIRAFYVGGDYAERRIPTRRYRHIQWTDDELEEIWQMVSNHRYTMEKKGTAPWAEQRN